MEYSALLNSDPSLQKVHIREEETPERELWREGKIGRRLNGFLGLSLNDRTILFLVILLDKTVSV